MPNAEPTRVINTKKVTTKPKVFVEKRDRPAKLIEQFQNEYVGKTIMKKILNITVQTIIRELIAVTSEVQKMLTKAFFSKKCARYQ